MFVYGILSENNIWNGFCNPENPILEELNIVSDKWL